MSTRDTVILRRTMVMDTTRGRVRILDFCLVNTSLGTMLEPTNIRPKLRALCEDFVPDDPLAYVDDIVFIDGREKYRIQNPNDYGRGQGWKCLHDLQLFHGASSTYKKFGKTFKGPAGA
jgi:hypothetical protein